MANVKVAVRVRPLSKREHAEGRGIIVEIEDRVAKVKKVKVDNRFGSVWGTREKVVAFGFDYCYWSIDPEDSKYASQEVVFQDLGTMVLSSAFKGYNICLFAYGQTGSGKTYTMMGTPASIGLTPRICQGLFSREGASSKQSTSCRVEVSFLEIYNEQVRDLLRHPNHKKPYTLRVREHPEMGPYVQGLSQHVVTDYRQVVQLLEEGIANRITAATHVHDASSRSHAIFTIQYTQAILENNLPSETASKINLVDLAGSEKADPSYCKHRITEGANINKSLVTLGIVISTLAENTQMFSSCQSVSSIASEVDSDRTDSYCGSNINGCKRQAYVPYRDSILTWLLKDSLGGNSKTIMIATISPASCCYNETVNTLRYASNAKKIINKPRVNEDANVKLIRELQEEIDRLKVMLMNFEMMNSSPSWSDDKDGNLTELVLQNEIKIDQLTKDWTDKWINRKAIMEEYSVDINKKKAGVTIDSSLPHFMAMDDDILSTGVLLYHLREGTTKIGRSDSNQEQDIVLQGQWIERDHCIVDNRHGIVTLRPLQGAHCVVNGHEVTDSVRLSQGALVVLGKAHKFRFNHPTEAALLRQRRSICETSSAVNCRSLEWLDLDGDFPSLSYSIYPAETESIHSTAGSECKSSKKRGAFCITHALVGVGSAFLIPKTETEQSLLYHFQDRNMLPSVFKIFFTFSSKKPSDRAYEECQPKLKNHAILQNTEIQQQQQYVEELQQQILDGQVKAEQELKNDQAVINQQVRENQQCLTDEKKRLAKQEQRESAVQTEVKSYAEAGVQHESDWESGPSLTEQNKKKLVQLELLQKYSLKKAERHLRRKTVKLHLERIVKKQKLLEAKKNLERLEATCWISKESVKSLQLLNQDTSTESWDCKCSWPGSNPDSLQCQRKTCLKLQSPQSSFFLKSDSSQLSTSAHSYACSIINPPRKSLSAEYLPRAVQELSRRNIHEEKDGSFLAQKQLIKKQDTYVRNKGIVENNHNTEVIYLGTHNQTMERSDNSLRPTKSKVQISKACTSDHFKEKHKPETKKEGPEIKELGELIQYSGEHLEENAAQEASRKFQVDKRKKHQSSLSGNSIKKLKKSSVRSKPFLQQLTRTPKNFKKGSLDKQSLEQHELLRVAPSARSLNNLDSHVPLCHGKRRWCSAEVLSDRISKTVPDPLTSWQEDEDIEFSDTDSTYSVDSLSCANSEVLTGQLSHLEESAQTDTVELEGSESDDSQMSQDSLTEKENETESQDIKNFPEIQEEPIKLCKDNNYQAFSLLTNTSTSGNLTIKARSFSLDSLGDADEVSDLAEESKLDAYDEVPAEVFWKQQNLRSNSVVSNQQNKLEICSETVRKSSVLSLNASSFYLDASSQSSSVCDQTLNKMKISFSGQGGSEDQVSHIVGENLPVLTDAWLSNNLKNEKNRPIIAVPSSQDHSEFQVAQMYPVNKSNYWMKKDGIRQSAAELSFVSCNKKPHQISHEPNKIEMLISSTAPSVPLPETRKHLEVEAPEDTSSFSFSTKNTSFGHVSIFPTKPWYCEAASLPTPDCQQPNSLSEARSISEWKETSSCLKPASESLSSLYSEISRDQDFKNNLLISVPNAPILQKEESYVNTNFEECLFRTIEKGDANSDSDSSIRDSKTVESNHTNEVAFRSSDQFATLMQNSEAEKVNMQEHRDVLTEVYNTPALEGPIFREVEEEVPQSEEWDSKNKSKFQTKCLMSDSLPNLKVDYSGNNVSQKALPTFNAENMMEKSNEEDKCTMNSASKQGTPLSVPVDFVIDKSVDVSEKKANTSLDCSCEISEKSTPQFSSGMCYEDIPRMKDVCEMRSFMENNSNLPDQKHTLHKEIVCNSFIHSGKTNACWIPALREQKEAPVLHYLFNKNDCLGAGLHSDLSTNNTGKESRKTLGEDGILSVTASQKLRLYINKTSSNLKEAVARRIPTTSEGNQVEYYSKTINSEELNKLVISINKLESDLLEMKCSQSKSIQNYCTAEVLESRRNSESSNLIQRPSSDNEKCYENQSVTVAVEDEEKVHLRDSREEDLCASKLAMKCESNIHIPNVNHNKFQENGKQSIFPPDIKESSKSTVEFPDKYEQPVKNDIGTENIHGSEPSVTAVTMKYRQDTNLNYNKEDKICSNTEMCSAEILTKYPNAIQEDKVDGGINCSRRVDKEQRDARKNEGCVNSKLTGLQLAENTALLQDNQTQCFTNCDNSNGTKLDTARTPETYVNASKLEKQDELGLPEKHLPSVETHVEKGSANLWNHVSEILKDSNDSADLGDNKGVTEQCGIKKELVNDIESIHASQPPINYSQNSVSEHCDTNFVGNSLDAYKYIPIHCLPKENGQVHVITLGQLCIPEVLSQTIKAQNMHTFKAGKEEEYFEENSENPEQDIFQDQALPANKCNYCFSDSDASLSEVSKQKELLPHMFSRNDTDIIDNLMPVNQRDALENTNQDYDLTSITVTRFSHDHAQSPLLQGKVTNGENRNSDSTTANDLTMPLSNVCNEVLQYYETQIESDETLSPVNREGINKSVEDLMLNKTSNSVSEQSPNKEGTYSKFMECHKSLDYASVDDTQNKVIPHKRLDSFVSHNVGKFHDEGKKSEQLLNSFNIPQRESATLDLIFSTSVFRGEVEEMTPSSQDCLKNSRSQKEMDSLVQYNQEDKCLVTKYVERECKTNIEKYNELVGCQTGTTEILACRTSHDFSIEHNSVATFEDGENLSGNSDKPIWEDTCFMEDYGSGCNMNSYISDHSAGHLNRLATDDLHFEESKYINLKVSDFPVSSADDYALHQQDSKIDRQSDSIKSIEEIYQNEKQGQNVFPECICDQANVSLQPEHYMTRTETKSPERNLLTPQPFNQRSSCEGTTPPKCSVEDFSACTLFKNASPLETPKSQECSTCSVCSSYANSQQDAFLASSLSATFQFQESNLLCHQDLPDVCCSSSDISLKSSVSHSETQIPAALNPAPLTCPSLATSQMQESQCEGSEILTTQLCASETILFLAKENECLPSSSSQRNSILDCSGIHNFKSEKKYHEVADCQEPRNIVLPQKECLENSDKNLSHTLNTNLDLQREQSTLLLNSSMEAINIPTTKIDNHHTAACKEMKAEKEILTSDQLNVSKENDSIPSRYLSINSYLTLQEEPASAIHKNKNNISTSQNAKRMKKSRQWPDLQSHSLSAPVIATSVIECASENSELDFSGHPASKSLQELNMSIEPPSPTGDDMYSAESLSKLKTDNVPIKYKPRFQKKSIEAQGDYKEQSQDMPSDSPPLHCLIPVAYSTGNPTDREASKYSNSITSLHGYHMSKNEELRYQSEATNELDQENNDSMHFNSSDINPYIHPWQQDECCKIGWKQYIFGSASDVSSNPPPLRLDNQTVMRCSSVDNGLNSQNSPFHSHLSSYANARMLSSTLSSTEDLQRWDVAREGFESTHSDGNGKCVTNISQDELETTRQNCISSCENVLPDMRCTQQSENTSTQVDEIVLLYPTKADLSSNKQQEILICERETQTEAPTKHKRQKRHRRSYTDVPAGKPEPSKGSFQEPPSWSSVQNISMHLSQLLHNTSELLGNLSLQRIKDNEPNYHKAIEQRTSFSVLDRYTQTTEDIGIQTDILGYPRSTIKDRQINANMKNDLVKSQEVNVTVKLVHPDTITLPKERTSESKGRNLLSMPDIRSHDVDTQEHYYMPQSTLGIHSSSSTEVPKTPLNISSPAFSSPKAYPAASSLYNSRLESSATTAASPASCISLSPNCYFQDKNPIDQTSIPETRELYCKSNLLVDRASSPILILSANPTNQQPTSEMLTSSCKASVGQQVRSTENSETGLKKKDSDLQYRMSSWEPRVDISSHAEVDSESTTPRESKDKRSGNGLDKNMEMALERTLSKKGTSKQKHRFTIDTHAAVHTERLYHSSNTLELSSHGEYVIDDHGETLPTEHSFHQIQAMRRARNFSGGIKSGSSIRNSECSPTKKSLPKSLNEHHTSSCVKSDETHECVPDSSQSCHQAWRNEKGDSFLKSEMNDMQDGDGDDDDTNTGSDTDSECNTEILLHGNTSLVKAHRLRRYSLRDLPTHNKFSNWCGVKGAPHSSLTSLTQSASDIHSQAEGNSVKTRATEIEERSLLSERRAREIERLQRERAQVMSGIHLDMSQQPLTVELTEAKLTYGIGETDAQLRILQNVVGEDLTSVPIKQQLYERHKKSIEILRKQREERLQCFRRSRSLSPQKHLSLLQTLDSNQRETDLPSRRREYLQQLRRDVVENTRVQEPKNRIQHPSEIGQLLRDYQKAREETKTEIARARDKLRERAEQEKRRIREQIYSQLQKAKTKLKTLVSTSTLHTDSTLSLSSGPTSGYNSSNTATYSTNLLGKQGAQVGLEDTEHSAEDARGRSAIRNHQLCLLKQLQKGSASEAFPVTSSSMERSSHKNSLIISPSTFSASPVKGYEDLSKHVLANATAEVMAVCSNDLKNLYSGQGAAGWKYQCAEKNVLVYYKAFSSSTTKHGFLGAGVINQPLSMVLCMLKDPSKRHLYDKTITTAQVHKKITSNIDLVYVVSDVSLCYQKQPRDFCCICVEAKEENMYILALQSIYEESMPRPCKEMVRGEILPSAWILEPDTMNGKDITKVIYMVQVDLGAPAIPARLLSSIAKRQPLVIAQLSHFLTA
ncbi:stAR-related lipid transfer protein 9 [Candoia aspera]|uniref:stAR-related lipid transfer protein 9 n=1 Tax=Candoia aspera TaxID=51853 RepID=UPI002FD812F9